MNLVGSFLLALLLQVSFATDLISPELRLTPAAGFLGGFTTYSTFNFETTVLLQERAYLLASMNITPTLVGCLVAGWAESEAWCPGLCFSVDLRDVDAG